MPTQAQIEANRRNWKLHRGISPEGRERISRAALRDKPWEHSTGPRTEAGKLRCRSNTVKAGTYCATIEPFASLVRFRAAIREFAKVIAERIMETGEVYPLLGPEADLLADAHQEVCDQFGVPAVEPTNQLNSASDLVSSCADRRTGFGPLSDAFAYAYAYIDICQAMRTIWNAQDRLCIRLEAEATAGAETGSLLS